MSAPIACIGPVTAQEAVKNDMKVSIMPDEYTVEALSGAIAEFFR